MIHLIFSFLVFIHPIYISSTNVVVSDEILEIKIKLFRDDLEDGLRDFHGFSISIDSLNKIEKNKSLINQYINDKSEKENTYDAIVVGTGVSGGWAAKELTEGGLKTLVLERGRDVKHVKDYPTMNKNTWELPYRDQLTDKERKDYQVQLRTGYTVKQSTKHWWVKDTEQPYTEKKEHLIG